jgi:hypothetical protein
MPQNFIWLVHELRDTAYLFWYNDSAYFLTAAACALIAATCFSLRRS